MTPQQQIQIIRIRERERARQQQVQEAQQRAPSGGIAAAGRQAAGTTQLEEPNNAQRQEVARSAAQRNMRRNIGLPGLSTAVQPLVNMVTDPTRRQEFGRSMQGAWNDIQSLPSLDWDRIGRETADNIGNAVQPENLARTGGALVRHIPQIAAELTGVPALQREEQAMQRLDMARIQGNQPAAELAARQANTETGQFGATVAAPVLGGGSVLRTAATAGALDAPFALSRNADTETLQERLPEALTEITAVTAGGAGVQGIVNAGGALSRAMPSRGAQMVNRMDRAGASVDAQGAPTQPRGVTPSLATANEGRGVSAPATNLVADNIFAGAPSRGRLRTSATELRDAVNDVRDAYGRPVSREGAGRRIEEGVERIAGERGIPNPQPGADPLRVPVRDWSAASKADAVYDRVLRPIESNPAQLQNTQSALQQLLQRADSPQVRALGQDRFVGQVRSTVTALQRRAQNGQPPTLRDLREMRRLVREGQRRAPIGPDTVDNAALRRLEGALTDDIYAAAGGMADDLRRADQYYRRMMGRIENVRRIVNADDPAQTVQNVLRAAAPRTENARLLAQLRAFLPDDEWRVFSASLIDEMGAPTAGARGFPVEQGFSIERFATNYRNMTPRARAILFGSRGGQGGQSARTMSTLADDLDNLAEIANAMKAVQAGANSSGSATHLQNIISIGGVITQPQNTVMALIGGYLTGEMLTNPAFVRWLVSAQGGPRMRQSLSVLQTIASRDPAIWPIVARLEEASQAQQSEPLPSSAQNPARTPQPEAVPIQ
jgi:hypothetical protein